MSTSKKSRHKEVEEDGEEMFEDYLKNLNQLKINIAKQVKKEQEKIERKNRSPGKKKEAMMNNLRQQMQLQVKNKGRQIAGQRMLGNLKNQMAKKV